jgi:class 3 adenylate cyclase
VTEPRAFERRIVSVLFADLVGFTPLSEGLDPEDVATIQDAYFATVRSVMERHGGQLEKFIGDAVMAVFGLPRSRDDDAERAVGAGLALISAVEALSAQLGLEPGRLQVRVGINSGEVVSAESGPDTGRVTGDTVNVSARLQAAAQPSQVLVGELTAFAVAATVELQPVEPLTLKGKAEPVRAAVATRLLPRPDRSRAMGSLRAPLIGREEQLERLRASLAEAEGTTGWLVVAPPGVGKSRLLAELAEKVGGVASVRRAQVRVGGASPFEPIAQLLLGILGLSGADGTDALRAALNEPMAAAGVPPARAAVLLDEAMLLVEAPRRDGGAVRPPATDRDREFAAWLDLFDVLERREARQRRRSVWLVEDLHWAAPDLLAFLDAALARSGTRAVVASTRPALLQGLRGEGAPLAGYQRLELEPLAPLDAAQLVRRLVGELLPAELVERIVARADGNALFIEELLRSWISVGMLLPDPSRAGWRLAGSPEELPLPATVQAIYAGQLDDLPANVRRLARRASVAGRRFVRGSLPALEIDDPDALDDLRTRALLVGPQPALLGEAFAYRHALLRDAGYASLARLERAELHVRLARWLEEAAATRAGLIAAEIAQHYTDALEALPQLAQQLPVGVSREQLTELAARWLELAAAQAVATAAPLTAATQLRRALELTPPDDSAALARRWLLLAEAIGFSANMDEAVAALDRAIELYGAELDATERGPGDAAAAAAARDGYGRAVALRGMLRIEQLQFVEAERAASEALDRLGADRDDLPVARVRYLRAWARVAYSPSNDVRDDLRRAHATAVAVGERQLELDARAMLDEISADEGEISVDEFLEGRRRIFELGMELGQVRRALAALRAMALMGAERGRDDAEELLGRALELAEAHAATEEQAWAHYAFSEVHLLDGRWEDAWHHGLAALEIAEEHAYLRPIVRTWSVLTALAHAQGQVEELQRAYAWFDPRRAIFPDSPFGRMMHGAVDARAAARGLRGPFATDESLLDAWGESFGLPSWYAAVEEIVGSWIADGRHALADEAIERMHRWDATTSVLGFASIELLEGQLRLAQGDRAAASTAARRALEHADEVAAPWWSLRAIRLLEACAAATPEQLARAASLAAPLGLDPQLPLLAVTS